MSNRLTTFHDVLLLLLLLKQSFFVLALSLCDDDFEIEYWFFSLLEKIDYLILVLSPLPYHLSHLSQFAIDARNCKRTDQDRYPCGVDT